MWGSGNIYIQIGQVKSTDIDRSSMKHVTTLVDMFL